MTTPDVRLVLQTPELFDQMDTRSSFASNAGLEIDSDHLDQIREIVRFSLKFYDQIEAIHPWVGYLGVHSADSRVVGCCGFKGNPKERRVEIAYHTLADLEGHGFATAIAGELARVAEASADVDILVAHTLPERNASCRVLEKNSFQFLGEVIDPDDGRVWLWERAT